MIQDSVVTISDLKRNPSAVIRGLKTGSKVIFVNNKPVAVISDIDNFDIGLEEPFSFKFNPPLDPNDILDHFKNKQ